MNTPNYPEMNTPGRQAAVNALAAIGFIALVAGGIWLAVSSTRFVPGAINRIGAAAVYLGSVFTPAPEPVGLTVVPTPTASTTISFGLPGQGDATSTSATSTSTTPVNPVAKTPGTKSETTVQIVRSTPAPALYGLPDLVVTVTTVGYLTAASSDSFVGSTTVPSGSRPAIRFTVTNAGTNISGGWDFSAVVPTRQAYTYRSSRQQGLLPGERIDYTLGFDRPIQGVDQPIVITINESRALVESNYTNNSATAGVTIQ